MTRVHQYAPSFRFCDLGLMFLFKLFNQALSVLGQQRALFWCEGSSSSGSVPWRRLSGTARVKVVVASFMQPAAAYRLLSSAPR